jgi:DNA invertase Pin-like site-specific DNA recombinase
MENYTEVSPFQTIESAQEYLRLLCDQVLENRAALEQDIADAIRGEEARRLDALRLIAYKLDRLHQHAQTSHRLLKELRSLRRLLMGEQAS